MGTVASYKNRKSSYLGNPSIKKDGVVENFTPETLAEYRRCLSDPVYFIEKYIKVINLDRGLEIVKLYPYQKNMIGLMEQHRYVITLAARQSGKSIAALSYLLWYALFHTDKTVAILANKGDTARDLLARITLALENIPFFLQPGCKTLNKGTIEFSTNTKIIARATTSNSIRSQSISLLYLDEFAFVERAETFYTSTYPVVTAGKSTKIIVTSTANGIGNPFYRLWQGALQGKNSFVPFRVDWYDVPGRDEKWKEETIANTSPIQFAQEFSNEFLGIGNTLINGNVLLNIQSDVPELITRDEVMIYKPPEKDHVYVISVDVAQGRSLDYTAFSIIDITKAKKFIYAKEAEKHEILETETILALSPPLEEEDDGYIFDQVATYRNNQISPLVFPDLLIKYAKKYNNAFVLVENNDQGIVVCNSIHYEHEYENMYVSSSVSKEGLGVRTSPKVKRIGCSTLKDIIEQYKLRIRDKDTLLELSTYIRKGKSWEAAEDQNDDTVAALVVFGWYISTNEFNLLYDIMIKDAIYKQQREELAEYDLPFGFNNSDEDSIHDDLDLPPGWEVVEKSDTGGPSFFF